MLKTFWIALGVYVILMFLSGSGLFLCFYLFNQKPSGFRTIMLRILGKMFGFKECFEHERSFASVLGMDGQLRQLPSDKRKLKKQSLLLGVALLFGFWSYFVIDQTGRGIPKVFGHSLLDCYFVLLWSCTLVILTRIFIWCLLNYKLQRLSTSDETTTTLT